MKTDLSRILAISGQRGLFAYVSQSRNGIIAESLETKKRSGFGISSKMTTLADISIYTDEEEMRLQQVFEAMHTVLGEEDAPSSKSSSDELKAFFEKALPTYDRERFYVSHMKKVVEWYNCLKHFSSLDFETPEEAAEASAEQAAE